MENISPIEIDYFPRNLHFFQGFSMAMLNNQMVKRINDDYIWFTMIYPFPCHKNVPKKRLPNASCAERKPSKSSQGRTVRALECVTFWHGEVRTMVTFWHPAAFTFKFQAWKGIWSDLTLVEMAQFEQVEMKNWTTGEVVGWWDHLGVYAFGRGLQCDYFPTQKEGADGAKMVPYHKHSEGYFWLR